MIISFPTFISNERQVGELESHLANDVEPMQETLVSTFSMLADPSNPLAIRMSARINKQLKCLGYDES